MSARTQVAVFALLASSAMWSCSSSPPPQPPAPAPQLNAAPALPQETHLADLQQLTFSGENADARRLAAEISLVARCDLLSLVAEADIRGRKCQDLQRILDNIELYREYCRDEGCFDVPRRFASPHTRFLFFRTEGRHPDVEAWDDTKSRVVVMSGLPGSGKDTFVKASFGDWPVVSLDGLREELEVDHSDDQGKVVQAARERARDFLRKGESFVWNATNISRRFRGPLLSLLADYHAHITIVYVEASREILWSQNRGREAVVPERVIRGMMDRWEIPDVTEAHEVRCVVR